MAAQTGDATLKAHFTPIANELTANEAKINSELINAQGKAVSIGGYYRPNAALAFAAMRPSATFNAIISEI